MDLDDKNIAYTVCCVIVFVISIILFACSFDTVEPTQYGLNCNSFTKTCNQKDIYEGGRYFIWLFHYFVTFPQNLQTIEFSNFRGSNGPALRTRTKEGLALGLHVSFQYKLMKEEIPQLYTMSNKDYENTFIRIARDVILQAAGEYEAPEYWLKRQKIGNEMQIELDKELKKAHARCVSLQLLNIELPDNYENSIVDTQVEVQRKRTKQFEQQAELIRQEIRIMESSTEQQIKNINSTAQADGYIVRQQAVASATNLTIEAESDTYAQVQQDVGVSGQELTKYIYYQSMMGHSKAKLLIGVDNALVNTPTS